MLKRYLVFTFDDYYARGGWNDFNGSFDSEKEALVFLANWSHENFQIVDSTTGVIIEEG